MKRNLLFTTYGLLFTVYVFSGNLYGLGLSTDFNNIFIENLQIGQEYNLTKVSNLMFKAKNTSENKVKIKVQPVYPGEQNLREGFEIIPSTDWLKLSKTEFDVAPQGYAVSDVIITIPENKKYLGKKFQVNMWSHISSVEGDSGFMSVTPGVEGVLLFSIAPVEIKEKIKPVDLSFELNPTEVFAVIDSSYCFVSSIEIKNTSKKTYKYEISQASPKGMNISIKEGYEILPDNLVLSFFPERLKIKKKNSKMFNVFLTVPENVGADLSARLSNKKFFGLIEVKTSGKGISGRRFIKTFVELK